MAASRVARSAIACSRVNRAASIAGATSTTTPSDGTGHRPTDLLAKYPSWHGTRVASRVGRSARFGPVMTRPL